MHGLLRAGLLLAPALARAANVFTSQENHPSALITLDLPQAGLDSGAPFLSFRFDVHESPEACGPANVTLNGAALPELGWLSLPLTTSFKSAADAGDREADAPSAVVAWETDCVSWGGQDREQILRLRVVSVNGVDAPASESAEADVVAIRLRQTAPVRVALVEGASSVFGFDADYRTPAADATGAPEDDKDGDDLADLAAWEHSLILLRHRLALLQHDIRVRERYISDRFGTPVLRNFRGPPNHFEQPGVSSLLISIVHQISGTARSLYGGLFGSFFAEDPPHGNGQPPEPAPGQHGAPKPKENRPHCPPSAKAASGGKSGSHHETLSAHDNDGNFRGRKMRGYGPGGPGTHGQQHRHSGISGPRSDEFIDSESLPIVKMLAFLAIFLTLSFVLVRYYKKHRMQRRLHNRRANSPRGFRGFAARFREFAEEVQERRAARRERREQRRAFVRNLFRNVHRFIFSKIDGEKLPEAGDGARSDRTALRAAAYGPTEASASSSHERTLSASLEEEIAEFRAAADVVGQMISAEEGRSAVLQMADSRRRHEDEQEQATRAVAAAPLSPLPPRTAPFQKPPSPPPPSSAANPSSVYGSYGRRDAVDVDSDFDDTESLPPAYSAGDYAYANMV